MEKYISRREFLYWLGIAAGAFTLNACAPVSSSKVAKRDNPPDTVDESHPESKPPNVESKNTPEDINGNKPVENQPENEPAKEPQQSKDALAQAPFLMPIEEFFSIKGRGTVVVGKVERGTLEANQEVEIIGILGSELHTAVTGIEQFNKLVSSTVLGEKFGLLLRSVALEDLHVGQVVAEPGSITAYKAYFATIRMLSADEGAPSKPIFMGYRPQVRIWTLETTGTLELLDGLEMVMPGESANVKIELIVPAALELGTEFSLLEKGRLIGTGSVTGF